MFGMLCNFVENKYTTMSKDKKSDGSDKRYVSSFEKKSGALETPEP